MKKIRLRLLVLTILFSFTATLVHAGTGTGNERYLYLILLKDKSLSYVQRDKPETYLTQKALERRKKYHIPVDSLDYPVSRSYIESIKTKGLKVHYASRWLNGIVVSTDEHDKARSCLMLFYVDKVYFLGKQKNTDVSSGRGASQEQPGPAVTDVQSGRMQDELKEKYASGYEQLNIMNGVDLHGKGYTGKGVTIAVFDAGFYGAKDNPIFDNITERVVHTWDLVDGEENVYNDDSHGAHVLTCMAAKSSHTMIGSAPEASYLLFRTESARYEYLYEELHWIRAAEIADSLGVDIINSSLGYTYFDDRSMDHSWDDLGGGTWISQCARIAVSRGILVVNAAGNEGNDKWKYINPPADMPEVLAVGAVRMDGSHVNFSSYGHPHLSVVKPDICAPGYGVSTATSTGKITHGNGTSYASPIVCGLAACLLQAHPESSPGEIIAAIINSADRRLSPDSAYGHGVPDFIMANAMLYMSSAHAFREISDNANITADNKSLLYVPNGEVYEAVFYKPAKFLFFNSKKSRVKVSGLVLSTGFAIVELPAEFASEARVGVKVKVKTNSGKTRFKQILKR